MESYHFEQYRCPRWSELPDLGLYMDQVLIVVEGALRPLFPNDPVILTSTMVNNYVKQQVLIPSEKKKYTGKACCIGPSPCFSTTESGCSCKNGRTENTIPAASGPTPAVLIRERGRRWKTPSTDA